MEESSLRCDPLLVRFTCRNQRDLLPTLLPWFPPSPAPPFSLGRSTSPELELRREKDLHQAPKCPLLES